ncbi:MULTISPECIES: hypothetical protein [Paenibacillus]|uniref:hypothetical protein n=1 Tax=Paenibacillus TaxID=44249 RepID=UPI0008AC299F|nr:MULTISPECIES: hypothetical protein [Paenibacillus]MCZ1266728.1 hypothetical protein [Paenibacillus tundrae]SEO11268.1 hypothetical protein SAMN05518670_3656 [Paenibacillus sp. OK076]
MRVEVNSIQIRHDGALYEKGASFSISAKGYEAIKPHVTVLDEVDEADEADTVTDPLESMEPDELRAYAADRDIDLGKATSKEGILEKIKAAEPKA